MRAWNTLLPGRILTIHAYTLIRAFFGILTSLLIPPNAPVQMYLFGITIYMVGECVGWSIGCIAMKIALKVRNQEVTRESLLRVAQMYVVISASAFIIISPISYSGLLKVGRPIPTQSLKTRCSRGSFWILGELFH